MCARAVSVAVQRMDRVQSVDVSLNEGLAVATFAAGNTASVERIRTAIRENGFTPKDAEVRIRGTVEVIGDASYLTLPGGERFVLKGDGAARTPAGLVEVDGVIPETEKDRIGPWPLTVRRLRAVP